MIAKLPAQNFWSGFLAALTERVMGRKKNLGEPKRPQVVYFRNSGQTSTTIKQDKNGSMFFTIFYTK
jgi:hypothetical protein